MQIQLTTHIYIHTWTYMCLCMYAHIIINSEKPNFLWCAPQVHGCDCCCCCCCLVVKTTFLCVRVCVFAQSEIIWVGEIVNNNNQSSFCYVLPTYHICTIWKILFPYPHEYFSLPAAEFVFLIPSDSLLSQSAVVPCRAHRVWMNVP